MGTKTTTKQSSQSNSTSTNAPPGWTLPGLQNAGGMVQNALEQIKQLPTYQGDFVYQPDQALVDKAAGAYLDSASLAQSLLPKYNLDGYQLGEKADTSGVIKNAIDNVDRTLMEQWLPSIRSSSLDAGAYSGDRAMAVLPTNAIRNAVESAQATTADIEYQNYKDYEDRRMAAYQFDQQQLPALIDSMLKTSASSGDLITQALNTQNVAGQSAIDNAIARDSYDVQSPFRGLDIATQILQGLSGNYGTQTGETSSTSTTTQKTGGLGSVVQGIAGLGGMIAGGISGLGPVGAALGTASSAAAPIVNAAAMTNAFNRLNPFSQYLPAAG